MFNFIKNLFAKTQIAKPAEKIETPKQTYERELHNLLVDLNDLSCSLNSKEEHIKDLAAEIQVAEEDIVVLKHRGMDAEQLASSEKELQEKRQAYTAECDEYYTYADNIQTQYKKIEDVKKLAEDSNSDVDYSEFQLRLERIKQNTGKFELGVRTERAVKSLGQQVIQ